MSDFCHLSQLTGVIVWLTEYSVLALLSMSLSMLLRIGPILVDSVTGWWFVTVGWLFMSRVGGCHNSGGVSEKVSLSPR